MESDYKSETYKDIPAARRDRSSDGAPNVFTIGPDTPFLPVLAEAIVTGALIEGFCPANDPLSLASCTLYLPTRRAARGMGLALLVAMEKAAGRSSALLPRIRTLGDLDDSESLDDISGAGEDIAELMSEAARVIAPAERELTLARLARRWMESMSDKERSLFENENIVLPSSSADALRLASDLAAFMDQVETEEVDWQALKKIAVGEHAQWWALTVRFLSIVMESWPGVLVQKGRVNPAEFRRRVAKFRISRLINRAASAGPVIAAGSTGSIPATARLLAHIARKENGAVVLPGLDRDLPEAVFRRFTEEGELFHETAASTHPQFSMVRLLRRMKARPGDVRLLGQAGERQRLREEIVNLSLLPADMTGQWRQRRSELLDDGLIDAFTGTTIIEARNERQEALAIAIILREALEDPEKTAALVTPDRELARRVSGELERFAIGIDDSAGKPLLASECAMALRHLMRICDRDMADPVSWAAFFHGPIARALMPDSSSGLAALMELAVIRDCLSLPEASDIADAVSAARKRIEQTPHAHARLKALDEEGWQELAIRAQLLGQAINPLVGLLQGEEEITTGGLATALLDCCERSGAGESLFSLEGGEELLKLLNTHGQLETNDFSFHPREANPVFDVLLSSVSVRKAGRTHPRLQIFGTLEARLQDFDRVVLGGLNEGVWPPAARNDPFLNRPMRSELGLPLPERRIGLAAHDFSQLSGHSEVFYSRSMRKGGAPSVACRWLQRLETFLGGDVIDEMRKRGRRHVMLAETIDAPNAPPLRAERARACPPLDKRPKGLSITEIETWIRDPYAIHAKHILGLRPLPPLIREADPALRGSLYHAILADFIKEWNGHFNAQTLMAQIADRHFAGAALAPEIEAAWRPRFDGVAAAFIKWEMERRDTLSQSHCEVSGRMEVANTGFTLRGRADRIDLLKSGRLAVIDYKTGSGPSGPQARTLSPQLALEGAMASAGAFGGVEGAPLAALNYVRLKEGKDFRSNDITRDRTKVIEEDELAASAMSKLEALVLRYQDSGQDYVSRYAPVKETEMSGDYDHLARVREWSIGEDDDGGEAE